ncbi:TlpA family protein disulfide reductase [Idiomarina tyrosinivorans]|uniref:TlpA family protein disulfide reductase n=1 Tax=Idiomarina tyrosinivorans TaxID=1445662 RepID=A0A432ZUH9_9GAMM|nr:TlpA disulfide reductase family protein [Idiomarina tyrosinivorans]RUO81468.1 TlpA family protein disulfide reductase [Idiomarina tyrosinivorans]
MNLNKTIALCFLLLISGCQPQADFHSDDQQSYQWQQLQGKTVVVNFFAEWCAPCLREVPELNRFYQQKGDDVKLFGVSFDPMSNQQLAALKSKHHIGYPLVLPNPAPKFPFERPKMLPATYIVHSDGSVTGPLLGEQTVESLNQALRK